MKSILWGFLFLVISCNSVEKPKNTVLSKSDYKEKMIESHKAYLAKEKDKINDFILSTGLDFEQSQTGLRYHVYSNGSNDSIQIGEIAVVDYVLTLLNGDTAYTTLDSKPQQFVVEFDNVENGLHEGIQKMAVGDSSILILPAHLGYGITGDQSEIPSQSILVYYLKFLAKIE
jgi:FKBP-type peptidyl-prolyl cis-trans isomerase